MLNIIWLVLVVGSAVLGAINGKLPLVIESIIDSSKNAVSLAFGLIGIMAFWLGIMKIAEKSGLIEILAKVLYPVLRFLFPEIPARHPALGAIMLSISMNMLGLNNAATPFGIRAMEQLEKLNPTPGTATHAMCMFLVFHTSSIQLIPVTAIAILAANGDTAPTRIIIPVLISTFCSTMVGVVLAKFCSKLKLFNK